MQAPIFEDGERYTRDLGLFNPEPTHANIRHTSERGSDDGDQHTKPGPEPDRLKVDTPYEEALRKALKKKPAEGWPKHKGSDEHEGS